MYFFEHPLPLPGFYAYEAGSINKEKNQKNKMAKKRNYTQEDRQAFADFMRRTRTAFVLRKIAAAYDWASDDTLNPTFAFANALERENMAEYLIRGRQITLNQAQIIYDMIRFNKYGGLNPKSNAEPKTFPAKSAYNPVAKSKLKPFTQLELFERYRTPDGWPIALTDSVIGRGKQSVEDCLREQDERTMYD